MGSHLAHGVRAPRVEPGGFGLGCERSSEHPAASGQIDFQLASPGLLAVAHCLEQTERSDGDHVRRVLWLVERSSYVALRAEVIDLIRPDGMNEASQSPRSERPRMSPVAMVRS